MNNPTNQNPAGAGLPQLFNPEAALAVAEANDAAAVARATQEVQAALAIAQRFPRNELLAIDKITKACQRKSLAEMAEYEYPRGGTRITGPTIVLLTAIANRWGNIRYGWAETERRDGASTVRCFAWDLQSNGQAERTFSVRHIRDRSASKGGAEELTDERDIYELLANMAARRVRACLEQVIDQDVVEMAIDQCRKTLREGEKIPLRDRALQVLQAFQSQGVDKAMIEARLGNSMESISENQLASLRRIWKSLSDGVGKREDYFKAAAAQPDFAGTPAAPAATAPVTAAAAQNEYLPSDDEAAEAAAGLAPVTQPAPAKAKRAKSVPQATTPAPAPAPAAAPAAPATNGNRLVTGLRNLCTISKCPEGKLLEFATSIGVSDGSPTSLEELCLLNSQSMQQLADNWPGTLERIKAEIGI